MKNIKRKALIIVMLLALSVFINPSSCIGNPSDRGGGGGTHLPPATPTDLSAELGSIDLSWRDNSNNEDGFKIERKIGVSGNFAEIASVGANVTTFVDEYFIHEGEAVFYRVFAYNSHGNSKHSNEASIATTLWTGMLDLNLYGNYAYCSFMNGLVIVDISNPATPHKVSGLFGGLGGSGRGIDFKDSYVYLAYEKKGMLVIYVSDPQSPKLVGSFDTPDEANDVFIDGNYAYIADGWDGVYIVDISTPASPTLVSSINTSGYAHAISVQNNYAYVADGSSGLQIIDVSDKSNPSIVGSLDTEGTSDDPTGNEYLGALDVFINGNYAYIANDASGMIIIDVSNPSSPQQVGIRASGERTRGVYVSGTYAYMADFWWGGLQIVDVSNPSSPVYQGGYHVDNRGYYEKVAVVNNYAFIAASDFSLQIIDVSNPSAPAYTGSYNESDYLNGSPFLKDSYLYIATNWTGFNILDVSNPMMPINIGHTPLPSAAADVYVVGDFAYVADTYAGLQIVDVSNPFSPNVVGSYPTYGQDVSIKDNYAYVSTGGDLEVIDISNKTSPAFIASCSTNGFGYHITINNNYAYLATWSGLRIIDISNPSSPSLIGSYDTSQAMGVYVDNNFAYVADNYEGFLIFDVTNPTSPSLRSSLALPDASLDLIVQGNMAYIANADAGLQVVNISDKSNPFIFKSYDTPGAVIGVIKQDSYLYISQNSSLLVLGGIQP